MPNIRTRLGDATNDATNPQAKAIVACALTCLDVAIEIWASSDGEEEPRQLYDRAVAAVRS